MLELPDYLLGAGQLLAIAAASLLAGVRVRSRLLPSWTGPPAWLATAVVAVALVVVVAELLGTLGLFDGPWMILGLGAAAIAAWRLPIAASDAGLPPAPDPGRGARLIGLLIAAVAVAHFTIGLRLRLSTGMTGFDTTWYHAPFAAGFAQSGNTFDIQFIAPQFLAWFYPQNSELFHAVGMLAFERDLLSPFFSLAWLGGCLLAAWCVGRPFGVGPASLAGAALVLGGGAFADQSGEARNDIAAIFFLLAAAAIAVNAHRGGPSNRSRCRRCSRRRRRRTCCRDEGELRGVAAVHGRRPLPAAPVGRRRRALAIGVAMALLGGGYWYLRNLVQAGSPLPWVEEAGPLELPGAGPADRRPRGPQRDRLHGRRRDLGGLARAGAQGRIRPALAALLALGGGRRCLAAAWRRREPALRLASAGRARPAGPWLVAPASAAGPDGTPVGFFSGLRYLAPGARPGLGPAAHASGPARTRCPLGGARRGRVLLPFADASGAPGIRAICWSRSRPGRAFAAGAAS